MNEMIFQNATLRSGRPNTDRWISEDGMYVIARYYYWREDGGPCGARDASYPYFRAYTGGQVIIPPHGTRNYRLDRFEQAADLCMTHREITGRQT